MTAPDISEAAVTHMAHMTRCAGADKPADMLLALRRALTAEQAANLCDTCLGQPISGKPCMCGGTGKMSDAAVYLRHELVKAQLSATAAEKHIEKLEAQLHEVAQQEPQQFRCEHCDNGRWEAECCNGSSGCSCGGEPVDMGPCRVCNGTGWRTDDADRTANLRSIQGLCYLGSGPR